MNTTRASLLWIFLIAPIVAAALPTSAVARSAATHDPVPATLAACSWDRPGVDPFMGDVVAAVDRYQDIAVDVRARLKARMARRDYDDVVSIRRDSIAGRAHARYGSAIRDMHFGDHRLCRSVSRAAWSAQMQERGLVYCDSGQCVLVPTICRNVSRIARAEVAHEHAEGDAQDLAALPVAVLERAVAAIPLDAVPDGFAPTADPAIGSSPDSDAIGGLYGSGFGGASGGGIGSFAAGVGGVGHALAAIAANSGQGSDFDQVLSTPSNPDVTAAVTQVPETETWGLMLAGLFALGARRRRIRLRVR